MYHNHRIKHVKLRLHKTTKLFFEGCQVDHRSKWRRHQNQELHRTATWLEDEFHGRVDESHWFIDPGVRHWATELHRTGYLWMFFQGVVEDTCQWWNVRPKKRTWNDMDGWHMDDTWTCNPEIQTWSTHGTRLYCSSIDCMQVDFAGASCTKLHQPQFASLKSGTRCALGVVRVCESHQPNFGTIGRCWENHDHFIAIFNWESWQDQSENMCWLHPVLAAPCGKVSLERSPMKNTNSRINGATPGHKYMAPAVFVHQLYSIVNPESRPKCG